MIKSGPVGSVIDELNLIHSRVSMGKGGGAHLYSFGSKGNICTKNVDTD